MLARTVPDGPIAAVHALLAGHLYEAGGASDKAKELYTRAFDARPSRGKAFEALRRIHAQAGDADTLAELFGKLPEPVPLELAAALEECNAADKAIEIYQKTLSELGDARDALPVLVRLEHALFSKGRWSDLYQTLTRRYSLLESEDEKAAVEGKRRWVLAEHLAETDEAWDIYRQLHEESPEDAEVLEAPGPHRRRPRRDQPRHPVPQRPGQRGDLAGRGCPLPPAHRRSPAHGGATTTPRRRRTSRPST